MSKHCFISVFINEILSRKVVKTFLFFLLVAVQIYSKCFQQAVKFPCIKSVSNVNKQHTILIFECKIVK